MPPIPANNPGEDDVLDTQCGVEGVQGDEKKDSI